MVLYCDEPESLAYVYLCNVEATSCIPSFHPLRVVPSQGGWVRTFCAEEFAGYVKSLASYDHDLLSVEQLLGDSTGQTA